MSESHSDPETDTKQTTQWAFYFFMGMLGIGLLMAVWMLISSTFF